MVNDMELAALIVKDIFDALSTDTDQCQRLEGKGGRYPAAETKLAGFGQTALIQLIASSLSAHRSY